MNNQFNKSPKFILAAACVLAGALYFPAAASGHNMSEHAANVVGDGTSTYKRSIKQYLIPDVQLTDYDDRPVRLRELLASGDPVMMNFIFTTCATICPVTTKVLSDVSAKIGGAEVKRLRLVSISIDPENDTPLQLKAYAKSFQAGERWKFLTGSTQDVKSVLLALDSYRGDKMSHEPVTLIRQASGKLWVRIDGFATPDELVREYRKVTSQ
jgi:protein SCO1